MVFFFFQAEDGIRDLTVTGVQTCALPISVVAPDAGGVERARFFAKKLDAPLAIVDKRRVDVDRSEERRVGKSVDLGGRRIIKKKKHTPPPPPPPAHPPPRTPPPPSPTPPT